MSSGRRRPEAPRVGPERAAGSTPPRAQRAEEALDMSRGREGGAGLVSDSSRAEAGRSGVAMSFPPRRSLWGAPRPLLPVGPIH